MTPEAYCRDKTRGSGSSFFYAFLFLPEEKRRAMMALYAFCREVDDIADEVSDQQVALTKLNFWREELARTFAGQASHPVGHELLWCAGHFPINEELLLEILDGMQTDIMARPFIKQSDLSLYIYRVAGVVGLLSIEVFGYSERKSRDFATRLGEALQLTNILRDLAEDAAIGRIYIPQEVRSRYQVSDQAFKTGTVDESMQKLLQEYGDKAENAFRDAVAMLPPKDRESLRPSIVMATIYYAYLRQLRAIGFDVWSTPVRILPLRKMWIAWRAWRYECKACKRQRPIRLEF
ncbi:presqualene diphosphate synthase HpnD [Mariprofundus erugo]|uniref:Presqualene diphosphate synthase HpnD n=1 Tax=Mariprofundus erugo TaxID=2528639 RepID=A0A5R9GU36_9PROT|nr:presqualene diphosphate synthase HpnD [Mariprofundus erugo]TLS67582.1 presqualene diphosphate synthase HpnD [Mariprofundus erugo]TLS76245.1 presqualene diphosphate synthase HpnD [Mariprofundus erugo]